MTTQHHFVSALKLRRMAVSLAFFSAIGIGFCGTPPGIVTPPQPRTNLIGSTATFSVVASGDAPLAYRWRRDGAPIPGSTNGAAVGLTNVQASAQISVAISNAFGSITSAPVSLTVTGIPPAFTVQPTNQSVIYGGVAKFQVAASGNPSPQFRWYHNDTLITLTNGPTIWIYNLTLADAGSYYCVASNISGMATSQVVNVSVVTNPPSFDVQPTDKTVYYAGSANFYASAIGAPSPSLQWFHNDVLMPAKVLSTLIISPAASIDEGLYFCVASNLAGVATSHVASLTVISVPPLFGVPPDVTAAAETTAQLSIAITNPPANVILVYQPTNPLVPGFSRTNYFALSSAAFPVVALESGHFFFIGSNGFGSSTSQIATLTVTTAPPSVVLSISPNPVVEGSEVQFHLTVTGAPYPTLTSYHDSAPLPFLEVRSASFADEGDYTVVASNVAGVATSTVHLTVKPAGPLDRWTIRNPLPQGRNLQNIAWGQNQFVAVGENGAVVTSTDGTNWIARNAHTADSLDGIAYGNGRFVAISWEGTALASTDGETWNSALINSNAVLEAITFGNGNFLAAGFDNTSFESVAFRSTNGTDWIDVTIPPAFPGNNHFSAAAFGGGRFLVMDWGGGSHSSTDLLTWTNRNYFVAQQPSGAAYINGNFLVVGDQGTVNSSPNGITWPAAITNAVDGKLPHFYGIARGAGRYVIVMSKGRIVSSASGLNAFTSVPSPTADRLNDVIFANNLFVAVGDNGTILTSSAGLNWSNQTSGANFDLDGLGVGDGAAIAVGKNGTILRSTDGTHWNYTRADTVVGYGGQPGELHGVAYGNGKWVIVGESTNVITSTNGLDWEGHWTGIYPGGFYKSVIHANSLWVVVGTGGQIITSPDATTWTAQSSPTAQDLNEVTYGNGLFVVVGDNNTVPNETILTSPDGINWTDRSYLGGKNARGIAFANDLYVIAANDGDILVSSYGPSTTNNVFGDWHPADSGIYGNGTGSNLRGVTWSNSLWVVVGNNGRILTSTNAQTWHQRVSPTFENLHAVRYINNTFIAIGNEGVILQSAPLTPQLFVTKNGGNLRLVFSSPYEGVFKVQHSENFVWEDLALITNTLGTVDFTVSLSPGHDYKFFRVVAP